MTASLNRKNSCYISFCNLKILFKSLENFAVDFMSFKFLNVLGGTCSWLIFPESVYPIQGAAVCYRGFLGNASKYWIS